MKRACKYRLSPTRKQAQALQGTLDRCRELYNAALQERRDAYRMAGKSLNYYDQANQLPEIKDIREEYRDIHSQVLQDVLRKADKAFKAFFRRVKTGETPGYPRYKGHDRYDSFTYPQGGYSLTHDNRVCLSKIGSIKVKLHRPLEGEAKTCTIKCEGNHWYVVFMCEVEEQVLPESDEAVGIDLGLLHFATLSTGETIENPRYFRKGEKKVEKLQQALARKNKSIQDAGWSQFVQFCTYKAEDAGRTVVQVNPRYTSQVCSGCGTVKKKELSERWHSCECGAELDRDHNAAINILWLGSNQQAS